jgi:polygalacturonase
MIRPLLILALACCSFAPPQTVHSTATIAVAQKPAAFDVRKYGAKGDGKALDSPAINKAIDAAAAAGGGTVLFTAGTYRSFSIRLLGKQSD